MKPSPWIYIFFLVTAGTLVLCPQESMDASKIPIEQEDCVFGCDVQSSTAVRPYYAFEKTEAGVPVTPSTRWHQEYEKNRDYGESWFFLVQTEQDGVLFATISITNLGLRTFDSAVDVRFYAAGGEVFKLYRDYRREDISTAGDGLDLTIGSNRLRGTDNTYHLSINEARFQLDLTLQRSLPAFQFGNGSVAFHEDRSAEWSIGFDVPRAIASGNLTADGRMFNLAGDGYHDHTWSTIKLPSFMEKWYTLRLYQGSFSIILHQIHLDQNFGGGLLCAGLIADGDNLIPTRSFLFKPVKWRKEATSGLAIPTELQLCIKTENYSITGTVTESQFLDSINIFAQLAWPIQKLLSSFYTNSYLIRYLVKCDLVVIDRDGLRQELRGVGVVGANSF